MGRQSVLVMSLHWGCILGVALLERFLGFINELHSVGHFDSRVNLRKHYIHSDGGFTTISFDAKT